MKRTCLMAGLAALALLAGCGERSGPGGVTAEEERELDNAAAMLDDNMIDVSPDSLVANEAELEAMDASEGGGANSVEGNAI